MPGKPLFALIDSDSFHVDGYFEETKLPRIKIGDPARVYLVGERGRRSRAMSRALLAALQTGSDREALTCSPT